MTWSVMGSTDHGVRQQALGEQDSSKNRQVKHASPMRCYSLMPLACRLRLRAQLARSAASFSTKSPSAASMATR